MTDENDNICVDFLICTILFLYGCGPNLIISTIAVFVRFLIRHRSIKAIQIAKLKARTIQDNQEIELTEKKLADFDITTKNICISIVPVVGPIIAFYNQK